MNRRIALVCDELPYVEEPAPTFHTGGVVPRTLAVAEVDPARGTLTITRPDGEAVTFSDVQLRIGSFPVEVEPPATVTNEVRDEMVRRGLMLAPILEPGPIVPMHIMEATVSRGFLHHPALGRTIRTPEHLAGARVEEVRSEHNGGHQLTWYVLDRRGHEGDRIAVGGQDVTLEEPAQEMSPLAARVAAHMSDWRALAPHERNHRRDAQILTWAGVRQIDASHCVQCGDAIAVGYSCGCGNAARLT